MFGFNFGKKKVLGIDIGTSVIKMVELEIVDNKPPYFSNYAWMNIPEIKSYKDGNEQTAFETVIPECLKRMHKEAGFSTKEAYVSIAAFCGMLTIIELPAMPAAELEQAVRFEAHKYIPTSLDDVTISWEVISGEPLVEKKIIEKNKKNEIDMGESQKIQVFLAAAFKNKISNYEKTVHDAGLKIKGIEIESLSMVESLIGKDQGNFLIVDIGARVCNIIYVEKGIIRANRNIDAGGVDITKAISKEMGISEERAESFKFSGKNFFSADSHLRFATLDMISSEMAMILEGSSVDKNNHSLDAILLSGGTSRLIGLDVYFQTKFGVKTTVGNPFGRLAHDKKAEPVIEKIKNRFSVCIGLALKEADNHN